MNICNIQEHSLTHSLTQQVTNTIRLQKLNITNFNKRKIREHEERVIRTF